MPEKPIVNPYTFNENDWVIDRYKKIASFTKGDKILDLGCGNGRLKKVIKKDIEMHGIDIDKESISLCGKLGYNSIQCLNIDGKEKLPFPDNYFSTITCLDILEHLYDPLKALLAVNNALDKNGRLIISCPNIAFFLSRALLLFGIFSDIEIPQRIVNSHIRFFTIRRLKNILKLSGFKTKIVYGATPTPFPKIIAWPINLLAKIYPSFFAYNIILVAEKTEFPSQISKDEFLIKDKSVIKQIITAIKWG